MTMQEFDKALTKWTQQNEGVLGSGTTTDEKDGQAPSSATLHTGSREMDEQAAQAGTLAGAHEN